VSQAQHLIAAVGLAACWGTFAVTWIAGAAYNAARAPRERMRAPSRRFAVAGVIAAIVGIALLRGLPAGDWRALDVGAAWATGLGLAVLVASTAFAIWARVALGTMWSMDPMVKRGHELRTDGPYGVTRHPIYTGILGMIAGSILLVGVGRWLLLLAIGVIFVELRIRAEEQLMARTFPDEYPRYRSRVPQLIPGLRLGRRQTA
jgi:protein-S-isoprenylcysteine O-methyltransferase Ste14